MTKYRGKRVDNGEWVEGYFYKKTLCDGNGECCYIKFDGNNGIEIIPETIALFTTLTDKNGKEIFGSIPVNGVMSRGGDVVFFKRLDCNLTIRWSEVGYRWTYSAIGEENSYYVDRSIDEDMVKYLEIIGNQYDSEMKGDTK